MPERLNERGRRCPSTVAVLLRPPYIPYMAETSTADRDLLDKLGVREGMRVRLIGSVPADLASRLEQRDDVEVETGEPDEAAAPAHLILWRLPSLAEAKPVLARLRKAIAADGGIWVLTAKKGSPDYVQQERLIPLGKAVGLVDNKICSVDERTSAIRFVIPRAQREKQGPGRPD